MPAGQGPGRDQGPGREFVPRVLHIDHPPAILRLLERNFQSRGWSWESAETGAQGLHMALVQDYDLIFLGLRESRIDGLRVVNGLKRAGVSTPVVLLMPSRELDRRRQELSRLTNVLDCLSKPVDLRQVEKVLEFASGPGGLAPADKSQLLEVLARIEKALGAAG